MLVAVTVAGAFWALGLQYYLPVPLFNDVAHVRLVPVTDGDRTFWEWRCSFSTRNGEEEEMTRMVGEDIYEAGFAAIRSRLAASVGLEGRA